MRTGSDTRGAAEAEGPVINASELAEFTFCRKSWWLRRVCGLPPANRDALEAGARSHLAHNQATRGAAAQDYLAKLLLGAGIVALFLGLALSLLATGWQL